MLQDVSAPNVTKDDLTWDANWTADAQQNHNQKEEDVPITRTVPPHCIVRQGNVNHHVDIHLFAKLMRDVLPLIIKPLANVKTNWSSMLLEN